MPFGGLLTLAVGTGISMYGKHKAGKQKDKAARDQANLNNNQLAAQRMAQQKMLAGLESSGWNPYGVNSLSSSGSGTSTTNETGSRDFYSKENPFTTDEYKKSDDLVRGALENRLASGSSLPPGYEQNAIRRINEASAGGEAAARNMAARRGFSGAQTFGINALPQQQRAAQIADLRGSVPLLERDMMNQDMALQGSRQAQFGTGRETRSREDTRRRSTTNSSESGSRQVGPDLGGLASMLMPPGAQQSTVSPTSGWGEALQGIGGAAMTYGANKMGQEQDRPYGGGGGGAASSSGGGGGGGGAFATGFNTNMGGCPVTRANPFGAC